MGYKIVRCWTIHCEQFRMIPFGTGNLKQTIQRGQFQSDNSELQLGMVSCKLRNSTAYYWQCLMQPNLKNELFA